MPQGSPKKIEVDLLLADLALQLGDPPLRPPGLPPPFLPCAVVPARATPPALPYEPCPAMHTKAGPAAADRAQPQRCFPRPPHAPPRSASTLADTPGASSVPHLEKL